MFVQNATDRTTWDIFQKAVKKNFEVRSIQYQYSTATHTAAVKKGHVHAQVVCRLFKPKILYDIGMIKVLQRLRLQLQRLHNGMLARIIFVTRRLRKLYLLNSNHLSCRRVHGKIDTTVRPLSNKLATDPLERIFQARGMSAFTTKRHLKDQTLTHGAGRESIR